MSQTVVKRNRVEENFFFNEDRKEILREKKIAFFNKAVWKPWANVLGVLTLSGVLFLASLFI
ncbi:MAG: hypothetical protein ACRC6T_05305 [Sarcina sp.]